MLEAVNLTKAFEGRPVINNLTLSLKKGGRYALMGPSGCGKTTFLNLLMGLLKPDSGEIRGLNSLRISAVFQENRLLNHLTPRGNIRLVCAASDEEIRQTLLSLGLEKESLSQPVSDFSGGMKRRVALARALLAPWDLLLLDEPYKGLDDATRRQAMALVDRFAQGRTLLLVTHDPQEAQGMELIRLT